MAQPNTTYANWSQPDLIARVSALEAQLRTATLSATLGKKQPYLKPPKKSPQPFDPSRYHTRPIALKFAYLGAGYNGFEHHTNNTTPLPTVEEVLWRALLKTKLIFPAWSESVTETGWEKAEVEWEGTGYSKCGRTDKGVSAFGQVIGLTVRSRQPKEGTATLENTFTSSDEEEAPIKPAFDDVHDELPYIALLNRVLPSSIRVLAWCPHPPADFSARFSCKERRYRYFFTNPAYLGDGGALDIAAMRSAAGKLEGLHDFRNFCKVDPSKQITNFERRIFHADIHKVNGDNDSPSQSNGALLAAPELFYFEVRGSAFLWHQVRHLIAIIFLVGQGHEKPEIVDQLLDTQTCTSKPFFEMADDAPLVLWDCIFPLPGEADAAHLPNGTAKHEGYEDSLKWVYVGDVNGETGKDGKWGRNGVMQDLWALWRKSKMDEVLADQLMGVVATQGKQREDTGENAEGSASTRVFDGSERARTVGTYVPLMQRKRMEGPEVVNARYRVRKGMDD